MAWLFFYSLVHMPYEWRRLRKASCVSLAVGPSASGTKTHRYYASSYVRYNLIYSVTKLKHCAEDNIYKQCVFSFTP